MFKKILPFLVFIISTIVAAQTPSFPGAEGHGRNTTGGRGGVVYYVNNLTDVNSGNSTTREGSLRWCLNQTGTKTILFKVSGTIFLTSNLSISKDNVTIAGQSAPGDGICIAGFPVSLSANNVIIRYLRFRMGDSLDSNADGADALGGRYKKNIIVDHCSMSWSTDECVSIYGNENTTLQWCIVSESLRLSGHTKGAHGYGGIWGGKNASFHHNLMAHHDSRVPRLGPSTLTQLNEYTDVRNNVFYNYNGSGAYGAEAMNANMVNNFYKPGPASKSGTARGKILSIDKKINLSTTDGFYPINNKWGKFYIDGNAVDASTSTGSDATACNNATANNWQYGVYNQFASQYGTVSASDRNDMKVTVPFDASVVTTHTAHVAYEKVLAHAGASLVRDTHDQRILNETLNGTAAFRGKSSANVSPYPKWGIIDSQNDIKPAGAASDWSPWPTLNSTTAPADTNIDGIPDGWLETNFPGKTATDLNEEGYTYLEVYLNGIVKIISEEQVKDGIASGINPKNMLQQQVVCRYNSKSENLIVISEKRIRQINVFEITGLQVKSLSGNSIQQEISIADLCKGMYLVQVLCEGDFFYHTSKILKL
jgi:hypothetical protein